MEYYFDNVINDIIENLEIGKPRKFPKKLRKIIYFITSKNLKRIGITKKMLMDEFDFSKDYAEKVLYEMKEAKIIVPSKIRDGHMMTYYLYNMQDKITDTKKGIKIKSAYTNDLDDVDKDIIIALLKEVTNRRGYFHNFRFQTKLLDKDDYDKIDVSSNKKWKILSERNKVKVIEFGIGLYRYAKFQMSPNGTVEIYISATRYPYDLRTAKGLSEFFVDLGKIEFFLRFFFSSRLPVEECHNWYVVRLDFNYDLKDSIDVSYISKGNSILQIKHFPHLYQFYTKRMPNQGLVLRLEERVSFKQPYKTIKELTDNSVE